MDTEKRPMCGDGDSPNDFGDEVGSNNMVKSGHYAIKNPRGELIFHSAYSGDRKGCWINFLGLPTSNTMSYDDFLREWDNKKREGYECVPVKLTEDKTVKWG